MPNDCDKPKPQVKMITLLEAAGLKPTNENFKKLADAVDNARVAYEKKVAEDNQRNRCYDPGFYDRPINYSCV